MGRRIFTSSDMIIAILVVGVLAVWFSTGAL